MTNTIYTIYTNDFSALNEMKASNEKAVINLINDYFDCISLESRSIGANKTITYTKEYIKHSNGSFCIYGYYGEKEFYINIECTKYLKGE